MAATTSDLLAEISMRQQMVRAYLAQKKSQIAVGEAGIDASLSDYLNVDGKSLRLAMAFFACGAFSPNGDDMAAIPLAAAVEVFHAFTLIHDDIMDQDTTRRGKPSVYAQHSRIAHTTLGLDDQAALHYGEAIGILTGDILQGWAGSLLADLADDSQVSDGVALAVLTELFQRVNLTLIRGQFLDIAYSKLSHLEVSGDQVIEMMAMKTGILYEFAGRAGAAIGMNTPDLRHPLIDKIARFASLCGTAFQIQDDVLGITGNSAQLGKAVGADIREGKKTLPVIKSLSAMSPADQQRVLATLGDHAAGDEAVRAVIGLIVDHGGVEFARGVAHSMLDESLELLRAVPNANYRKLLGDLAKYMINREK
jgi:geranylgeranyl diphosphate synthase type I